ncbi:MAG: response regulator [Candidatus Sericytochromatia bacterium]|nr:response regulator [Candidatus Sericytochromatia bacterium]
MLDILLAEDDPIAQEITRTAVSAWGYSMQIAADGNQAWEILQTKETPRLVLLDWSMPGLNGLEICQRVRASASLKSLYIIVLTASSGRENMLACLAAGADDYLEKPVDATLLQARIRVAERILSLQRELTANIHELQEALANVKELSGLLPICSYCKKIRNDENYWERLESYLMTHTHAQFSHSICPDCYNDVVSKELNAFKKKDS